MSYLFLPSDLDQLKNKITKLDQQLAEVSQDLSDALEQSSETWHDNAPYEIAKHNFQLLTGQQTELEHMYKNAQLVETIDTDRVGIGCTVKYQDQDGQEFCVCIGSYYVGDSDRISYTAPVAQLLLNARVGEVVEGEIGPMVKRLTILEIY